MDYHTAKNKEYPYDMRVVNINVHKINIIAGCEQ